MAAVKRKRNTPHRKNRFGRVHSDNKSNQTKPNKKWKKSWSLCTKPLNQQTRIKIQPFLSRQPRSVGAVSKYHAFVITTFACPERILEILLKNSHIPERSRKNLLHIFNLKILTFAMRCPHSQRLREAVFSFQRCRVNILQ